MRPSATPSITASTREWYETAWKAFKASRADVPARLGPAPLISKSDLQGFVVHLRERGVRPVSCNTWIRALNAFCRWLHDQGEIPTLVKLAPQRLEKRIVRTHDEAAMKAIFLLALGDADASAWRSRQARCR